MKLIPAYLCWLKTLAVTEESHFICCLRTEGVKLPKTVDHWSVSNKSAALSVCRDLAPSLTFFNQISGIVYEITSCFNCIDISLRPCVKIDKFGI